MGDAAAAFTHGSKWIVRVKCKEPCLLFGIGPMAVATCMLDRGHGDDHETIVWVPMNEGMAHFKVRWGFETRASVSADRQGGG